MSWARYITGWAQVEVTGAEPEKLLYALAERGIAFWDAAPPRDYALAVKVPDSAVKLIGPLAAAIGCEAVVRGRYGLPALLRRASRRYGLMVCVLLVLAVLFVGSAFIWDIQVTGNETIPDGPILQALRECGVDIGVYWPALSQDQVRNSVLLRLPGIRWMTVTIRGSHALVIVRESRPAPAVLDGGQMLRIAAKKAGLVEDVQPLHGTAETEPGMAVLPGETLIGGYTTGRHGVQRPCRAVGTVTARTWYELTARAADTQAEKAYTGRPFSRWALILGKTRINFYKDSSICPAGCDKIIESRPLAWPGVFTLPVTLERTVYAPYETRTAAADRQADMQARLLELLREQIGPEGEVLSSDISASRRDGVLSVTLRAECREQIGTEVPLTDREIGDIQAKIPKKTED